LTYTAVNKHLELSAATAKGHLKQRHQNYRSTKQVQNKTIEMTVPNGTRKNDIYIKPIPLSGLLCTDQTGAFPMASSKGNRYIMVAHHFDTNAIMVQPLPSRSQTHLVTAFKSIYSRLCEANHIPTTIRLDNEAPTSLKKFFKKEHLTFQLTPPHNHRRNYAEKAIGVFKDHFISGLCSLHPSFPLHLWCRLLPQAEDSLNMLRTSNINKHMSSYEELHGPYDYNQTPMLPPGLKILIHEKTNQRRSWAPRGTEGWYLGPAKEHYRCHRVYCTKTSAERITDTVAILPHQKVPSVTLQEAAIVATDKLTTFLNKSKNVGDDQLHALKELARIFLHTATNRTQPTPMLPQLPPLVPHTLCKHQPLHPIRHPHIPVLQQRTVTQTRVPMPQTRVATAETTQAHQTTLSHPYNLRKLRSPNPRYANSCIVTPTDLQCNAVYDADSGQMLEYRHLVRKYPEIWVPSMSNEFGRLLQGVGSRMKKGSETIHFISHKTIPHTKTVTYARIVCDYRPLKSEPNRTRLTVGGDRLTCLHDTSTDAADLIAIKLLFNSVLSTPNAKFITTDIKDFFLANNPLLSPEFMRIRVEFVPPEIIQQYNLKPLIHNGWLYIKIMKGMYGLKQAGYLANANLQKHLEKYGYFPCPHTRGLWKHKTRNIQFVLVVDDFGIKYVNEEKLHLLNALKDRYTIATDVTGANYCGLSLLWNYKDRTLEMSMPKYIPSLLEHLQFTPNSPEHSPHTHTLPVYGQKVQYATNDKPMPILPKKESKRIQQIIGSLLYYARAVDPTLLVALGTLASQQNTPTETTATAITQILNYVATHPLAVIKYVASPMILQIHSDASYLSEPKARSRAGGHFFLSNKSSTLPNGPIHTLSNIMRNVMASAAEAEIGAVFANAQPPYQYDRPS